ncbi:MAG TPA: hypothetical protein VI911_08980 [Patescibacteria group bacterium]|nr:MAG: hypothetical protein UR43_C0005G0036 [candidate division TM6 bacterium GW2011_GWF2_33_332]HLD91131.1 hypothetical protein [Patescibacteria group bacterium]
MTKEAKGNLICVKCGKKTYRNHRGVGLCRDCQPYIRDMRDMFVDEALTIEKNGEKERLNVKVTGTLNTSLIVNFLISNKKPEDEFVEFKKKKEEAILLSKTMDKKK